MLSSSSLRRCFVCLGRTQAHELLLSLQLGSELDVCGQAHGGGVLGPEELVGGDCEACPIHELSTLRFPPGTGARSATRSASGTTEPQSPITSQGAISGSARSCVQTHPDRSLVDPTEDVAVGVEAAVGLVASGAALQTGTIEPGGPKTSNAPPELPLELLAGGVVGRAGRTQAGHP